MTRLGTIDDLSVAVAHWHVNAWGGAENLVTHLADVVDTGAVYTIGSPGPDDPCPYGDIDFVDVTGNLTLPRLRSLQSRIGRVFEYSIWEDVDWREYGDPDIVLTSGATTRAVITPDDTIHVNYCHSPPRWFYDLYHDRKDSATGILARPLVRHLRLRDQTVDPRVDHYLVNSPIIRRRLWKYYKRESEVLFPPIDVDAYEPTADGEYYLHLGRLDREKGVPALVDAFADYDRQLVMAGGRGDVDSELIRRIEASESIDWRGFVADEEKRRLLGECRAVVFNGRNEDFGIVLVEATASGKPVLARDEGFPSLYVEEGVNGYRHDGTTDGIRQAVTRLESNPITVDSDTVTDFSLESFERQLTDSLTELYDGVTDRFRRSVD